LNGQWGVVDVEDSVNAARFLAARGDVDPQRLAIRGGSAGGFTTLAALVFTDVFKAGANYFGVSDFTPFVEDTHKFESRYLDTLVGPYPERKDLYHERSPANFVERISVPVITFQGTEDAIVPPSQSERIVDALRANKIPCAYVTYEGEQHGFRKAENMIHSLQSELYFYGRVFGFDVADKIEPVEIENL
jgi:dipeptidyl aminopeptidase/acylaminoacyl peptidase